MPQHTSLLAAAADEPRFRSLFGFLTWLTVSLLLIFTAVLSPQLLESPGGGLRLGPDLPFGVLEDPAGTLSPDEVDALPDMAFTWLSKPFSKGYSNSVHWLRVHPPEKPPPGQGLLWLGLMPPHLDEVTLYQRSSDGSGDWLEHTSGDTTPVAQRIQTRQLLLPVLEGKPLLLRLKTATSIQIYGDLWRNSGLLADLSRVEWASGVHLGIYMVLLLLIGGAALALRTRSLTASALLALMVTIHSLNTRGYPLLWLPESLIGWFDTIVRLSVFALPAAVAWQGREFFTQGTSWHRLDRLMVAHVVALLLAMLSVPTGTYAQWSWFAFLSPWLTAIFCSVVAWTNMWRHGVTTVRALIAAPYTLFGLLGLYMPAAYMGLTSSAVEPGTYWQASTLLLLIMIMVAVGAEQIARFQHAQRRQIQLLEKLARSEHLLEERVLQRTAELQQTKQTLREALDSERNMRNEQQQFFSLINHEFRTPLAIVDSAAAEQFAFPSAEIEPQRERAAQIRRVCRKMAMLLDNCLVGDRLDASAFKPRLERSSVTRQLQDAAQLAQWSRHHQLHLEFDQAPDTWEWDSMLVQIALSNLVDNAVKHAVPGKIFVTARADDNGNLRLSVCDQGPGLPSDAAIHLFERGHRGEGARAQGFGLGLWVVRRIAQLHGGDVELSASAHGGACFTIVLPEPALRPEDPLNPLQRAAAV